MPSVVRFRRESSIFRFRREPSMVRIRVDVWGGGSHPKETQEAPAVVRIVSETPTHCEGHMHTPPRAPKGFRPPRIKKLGLWPCDEKLALNRVPSQD